MNKEIIVCFSGSASVKGTVSSPSSEDQAFLSIAVSKSYHYYYASWLPLIVTQSHRNHPSTTLLLRETPCLPINKTNSTSGWLQQGHWTEHIKHTVIRKGPHSTDPTLSTRTKLQWVRQTRPGHSTGQTPNKSFSWWWWWLLCIQGRYWGRSLCPRHQRWLRLSSDLLPRSGEPTYTAIVIFSRNLFKLLWRPASSNEV